MRTFLLLKSFLIGSVSIILLLVAVIFSACKKEDVPEDNPKDNLFEFGATERYVIEGTNNFSISDNANNCEFVFPDGGTGELIVSELMSGPDLEGIPTSSFKLEVDGSGVVELLVPINGQHVQAFVYGPITGASVKPNIGENSWGVMLEQDTVDGKLRFELNLGDLQSTLKTGTSRYTPPKSSYFSISRMDKKGDNWSKLRAFHQTIREVAEVWLSSLPEAEHIRLLELMDGNMKFDVRISSSNYYQHFDNLFWGKNAIFFLKPSTTITGIAHEAGHYINHLLCGYNKYHQIYNAIPKNYYVLGSVSHLFGGYVEGRKYLLEDYAHFSEFLVTGEVEMHDMYNVASVNYFSQAVNADPEKNDYPSHEGFGAAILAGLMRTNDKMHYFNYGDKSMVPVPVFNIGLGEIIQHILAPGPVTINDLYANVYAYLGSLGEDELKKLPAFLEPLGWSYFGKGKLVDGEGKPLKDYAVRSIVIADKEYPGPLCEPSNDKGEFSIKRMPPGDFHLRVYANMKNGEYEDSIDIEQFISHESVTNKEVDLGEKVVEFREQFELISLSEIFDTRKYEPHSDVSGPIIKSQLDFSGEFVQSVNNRYRLGGSFLDNSDVSSIISLNIYCWSDQLVTGSFVLNWTLSSYNWTWEFIDQVDYKSINYVLSSDYQLIEDSDGPMCTFSKEEGVVEVTLNIDPKVVFTNSESRRFRLDANFRGKANTKGSHGNDYTSAHSAGPASVFINVYRRY